MRPKERRETGQNDLFKARPGWRCHQYGARRRRLQLPPPLGFVHNLDVLGRTLPLGTCQPSHLISNLHRRLKIVVDRCPIIAKALL
jgi:hypothetical protein